MILGNSRDLVFPLKSYYKGAYFELKLSSIRKKKMRNYGNLLYSEVVYLSCTDPVVRYTPSPCRWTSELQQKIIRYTLKQKSKILFAICIMPLKLKFDSGPTF